MANKSAVRNEPRAGSYARKPLSAVSWQNARLVNRPVAENVARLQCTDGLEPAIVGGPHIARPFSELGLIEQYRLWMRPTILGSGTPLPGNPERAKDLEILDVMTFGG